MNRMNELVDGVPRYEHEGYLRRNLEIERKRLHAATPPYVKVRQRHQARARGLLAWVQTCQAFAALRAFEQTEMGEKQLEREIVVRPLITKMVPMRNEDGTVSEQVVVLSELRRSRTWAPIAARLEQNNSKLATTLRAVRSLFRKKS